METTLERSTQEYSPGGVWAQERSDELLVFDVRLYPPGSFEAIKNDALGLITEKISGEEEDGKAIFDERTQIALQLTPPKHSYILRKHSKTGQLKMVAPEHLHPEDEDKEKDVLEVITRWRNGIDRRAMWEVRKQFFDPNTKEGEMFFWFSGQGQWWESRGVRRFNGKYGYFYAGRVVEEEGVKKLEVSDYKIDLDHQASRLFLQKVADSLHHTPDPDFDRYPLYKDMTTVARMSVDRAKDWTNEKILRNLSEARRIIQGDGKIFNLEVETILKLQNEELQTEIKNGAATEVATWITCQLDQGIPPERIQPLVRKQFIDATKAQLEQYQLGQNLVSGLTGGRRLLAEDLASLGYTGANGDFCGSWGSSDRSVIINGEAYYRTDSGELIKGIRCAKCGIVNICNKVSCFDCGAGLGK